MSFGALSSVFSNSNAYAALSQHLIPRALSIGSLVRSGATVGSANLGLAGIAAAVGGSAIMAGNLLIYMLNNKKKTGEDFTSGLLFFVGLLSTAASPLALGGSYFGFRWVCAGASVTGTPTEIVFNNMLVPFVLFGVVSTATVAKVILNMGAKALPRLKRD